MKIPKRFWSPHRAWLSNQLCGIVSPTCFEATGIKLWEADIISKDYVILVPFGYMHYGHQLYLVTLSLHQCGRQGMRCRVSSLRFGCHSGSGWSTVFWAVGCSGSNFKMLLQVLVLIHLPIYTELTGLGMLIPFTKFIQQYVNCLQVGVVYMYVCIYIYRTFLWQDFWRHNKLYFCQLLEAFFFRGCQGPWAHPRPHAQTTSLYQGISGNCPIGALI